jgi:Spy/CpxP family protein refolding chaperone
MIRFLIAACLAAAPWTALAQEQRHAPYAGMDNRQIKTLSAEDVEELRRGGGWGLALAAELNGAPGPLHLLELRDEIGLAPDQVAAIEAIFAEMRAEARAGGERLIATEAALEAAFRSGDLDEETLRSLLDAAEAARAELRFIHLSRHLATLPLLAEEQIAAYKRLRGYGSDGCGEVPAGHDPEMWRQHNCDPR